MRVARLLFPVCLCALPLGTPAARAQTSQAFSTPPTVPTPPAPAVPGPSTTGPTAPVSPPPLPSGGTTTTTTTPPAAAPPKPAGGAARPPVSGTAAPPPAFVGSRQAADHDVIDFDAETIRTSGPTDNQITAQGNVVAR